MVPTIKIALSSNSDQTGPANTLDIMQSLKGSLKSRQVDMYPHMVQTIGMNGR